MQTQAVLSPCLAHHVLWDRFVNTKGGIGRNIPCDQHNEHINKLIKHIITSMGGNLTEEALRRAARSVSTLEALCHQFDKCTGVPCSTHSHYTLGDTKDIGKVITTVSNRKLLSVISGRKHTFYPNVALV